MNNPSNATFLSIGELFENGEYIIPIYQRNYAWGAPEIEQLLQDIWDMASESRGQPYYLGSLVVHKRKDGKFETIDGQQRHTTLSIILAVLKSLSIQKTIVTPNLAFECRDRSKDTLAYLFSTEGEPKTNAELEPAMQAAKEVTQRFLNSKEITKAVLLSQYLLKDVKILRVVVPEDTDLNHYFEIMNNRGEQLEKHEVLKARMMGILQNQETDNKGGEMSTFSKIWDACAEMDRYFVMSFTPDVRKKLFTDALYCTHRTFEDLCNVLSSLQENASFKTLEELIKDATLAPIGKSESSNEYEGAYAGIINFPNFLLHVLRIKAPQASLDDKKLLTTFEEYIKTADDVKGFARDLFTCRQLLDRYIIKRYNDEKWSLRALKLSSDGSSVVPENSFEELNESLIMLISMFHVSYPNQSRKYWLSGALSYLYKASKNSTLVDKGEYLGFLEQLSDRFFFGRFYTNKALEYDDILLLEKSVPYSAESKKLNDDYLHRGTSTPNFIFNRLDYLLWKRLKADESTKSGNPNYIKARLANFSFTTRSSVEHYYPQDPVGDSDRFESDNQAESVDRFGNLCLISASRNSKLSNHLPHAKKEYYANSNIVESLKQVFMMSYDEWGPKHLHSLDEHEKMIIEVLLTRCK
ncbi:DUF262 domain-containing protein [Neptunomonas marina]|uniref:DUF262 domain-containing protein n=2 Tax=Neptunomonas marina TaxID=1815562 RepID=A0A437Q7S6_9GAMM|nr:DUF262 domain-containing protein [Neptunomonas marina]